MIRLRYSVRCCFGFIVAETVINHPKNVSQAYADINALLIKHGFRRVQGSVYVTDDEDMAKLFQAIQAFKALPWLQKSIGDIRAFRVEQWSDFTAVVKGP